MGTIIGMSNQAFFYGKNYVRHKAVLFFSKQCNFMYRHALGNPLNQHFKGFPEREGMGEMQPVSYMKTLGNVNTADN